MSNEKIFILPKAKERPSFPACLVVTFLVGGQRYDLRLPNPLKKKSKVISMPKPPSVP
jgi:hypothetical protein